MLTELFKIFGTIAVNNDDALKSMDETSDKAKGLGSSLASGIGNVAKGVGAASIAAVAAASAAVVKLTKASIDSYADFEQLAGGTELLFGDAYQYIMDKSKMAYSTVQMSQNDYLQQVNGFAVGLKTALGGNEQAAAELADKIVNAEADVVAATGNSQEAVQNAFNGIMKSNFTMLDNLQLGITPTKEGFQEVIEKVNEWNTANGNATQYQIDNLADCQAALVDYIEMQGLSEYAANEASETIQGSLASVKGAWSNLTTSLATGNGISESISALSDTTSKLLDNIIPRVVETIGSIGVAVGEAMPMLAEKISTLLPDLLNTLLTVVTDMLPSLLSTIGSTILSLLPILIDSANTVISSIIGLIPQLINGISDALPEITTVVLQAVLTIIDSLLSNVPALLEAAMTLFHALIDALPKVISTLVINLPSIISTIVLALIDGIPLLIQAAFELFMAIPEAIPEIIAELIIAIPQIIMTIVESLAPLGEKLKALFQEAWNKIKEVFSNPGEFFAKKWEEIKNEFKDVGGWFKDKFTRGKEAWTEAWSDAKEISAKSWSDVQAGFADVRGFFSDTFSDAWEDVKDVFAEWGDFFGGLWEAIKDKFSQLGSSISDAIGESVKTGINGIIGMIEGTINKAIGLINGAIKIINKIPGVDISALSELELPRLAKGGVLEKGQVGFLEGDGAEAVVPLENNRKWISALSEDMQKQGFGGSSDEQTGILREVLATLQEIKDSGEDLPGTLVDAMASGLKFNINNREFARMVKVVN